MGVLDVFYTVAVLLMLIVVAQHDNTPISQICITILICAPRVLSYFIYMKDHMNPQKVTWYLYTKLATTVVLFMVYIVLSVEIFMIDPEDDEYKNEDISQNTKTLLIVMYVIPQLLLIILDVYLCFVIRRYRDCLLSNQLQQ
ncbi:UNKNOWN [Stylonychia lemnae]|uniref:Uncharacterized protein n=1 Tax=Stylonychia lemnae TaxID=5949 RepID=A0A078AZW7_STYLE|nr:UNKNOWN [Stylonychia lemnae]|eukprot:CDW87784.1 UNKNOWN [Stylonychia lemnae]